MKLIRPILLWTSLVSFGFAAGTAQVTNTEEDEFQLSAEEEEILDSAELPEDEVSEKPSAISKADEAASKEEVQASKPIPVFGSVLFRNIVPVEERREVTRADNTVVKDTAPAQELSMTTIVYPQLGFTYPHGSFYLIQPYTFNTKNIGRNGETTAVRENPYINASYGLPALGKVKIDSALRYYIPVTQKTRNDKVRGVARVFLGESVQIGKWSIVQGNYLWVPFLNDRSERREDSQYRLRNTHEVSFGYKFDSTFLGNKINMELGTYYAADLKTQKEKTPNLADGDNVQQRTHLVSYWDALYLSISPTSAFNINLYPELTVDHDSPDTASTWDMYADVTVSF